MKLTNRFKLSFKNTFMKNYLTISVDAIGVDGYLFENEINLHDLSRESDILDVLNTEADRKGLGEVTEYEVSDWGDVPEEWRAKPMSELIEIAEHYANSYYDLDIWAAGLDCGLPPGDINDAYAGQYDSEEDFAQNMAKDLGWLEKDVHWPYTCIDWEKAARELMYDYCSSNGYYFRMT